MTYNLIGTGNMAWFIASRMLTAGHVCAGAWGRNSIVLDELCKAFSLPRLSGLDAIHDGPDACIIAVTDNAVSDVARSLQLRHTTLIHTAGSVSLATLAIGSENTGVVWPVYSIRKAAMPAGRGFPTMTEGNTTHALEVVQAIAGAISDTQIEGSSEQRKWMHLAAVTGNNFVNYLLSITADICIAQHLPVSLMLPLAEQAIANMQTQHPLEAQTGPARRGDRATIEKHLDMLSVYPQWKAIYETISQAIAASSGN